MSEQRESPNYAPLWLVVFYTFLLLVFIVAVGGRTYYELQDLQRRVGQLESQK